MTDARDAVAAGRDLMHELLVGYGADRPHEFGRMFNGEGAKVDGSFFAFVGRTGRLIAKLPSDEVRRLIDVDGAESVTMGKRTMREWVGLPQQGDERATRESWRAALLAAYDFVKCS